MYFSIKTLSSPKLFKASPCAAFKFGSSSLRFSTILIPFPPPPAEALSKTGKPIFSAILIAFFGSLIASV